MSHVSRVARALLALAALFAIVPALRAQEPGSGPGTPPAPPSAAPAAARPFLYELRGHGASAYLFGTVHLPDRRVLALPESVERAFAAADALYTEIPATAASELEIARASTLGEGRKLGDLVGEALQARLATRLEAAGLPAQLFDGFKPWAAASALPLLPILKDLALREPLDKALATRARRAKKRVGALETVAEQVAVFDELESEAQLAMLAEGLDQLERYEAQGRDPLEELVQAWLSGDPQRLLALLEEGFGVHEELSKRLEERLVWARNRRMAERIDAALREKPAEVHFFAVGALHLPDGRVADDATDEARARVRGLLTLLRARGYEVLRVEEREGAAAGDGR